jgi:hypothetical protein
MRGLLICPASQIAKDLYPESSEALLSLLRQPENRLIAFEIGQDDDDMVTKV